MAFSGFHREFREYQGFEKIFSEDFMRVSENCIIFQSGLSWFQSDVTEVS